MREETLASSQPVLKDVDDIVDFYGACDIPSGKEEIQARRSRSNIGSPRITRIENFVIRGKQVVTFSPWWRTDKNAGADRGKVSGINLD